MPIPLGVSIFASMILIPGVLILTMGWMLYMMEYFSFNVQEMKEFVKTSLIALCAIWIYSTPSTIAFTRKHPHRYLIMFLSLLTGWLLIPYIVAIHWSMSKVKLETTGDKKIQPVLSTLNEPASVRR